MVEFLIESGVGRSLSDGLLGLRVSSVVIVAEMLSDRECEDRLTGYLGSVDILLEVFQLLLFLEIRMVVIQRQGQFLVKVASVVVLVLDPVMLLVRNDIADEFYSRIFLLLVLLSLRLYDSTHELHVLRLENNFKGGVAASLELLDIFSVSDGLYDEGVGS